MNANGKVPTLVDGGQVLWEADAILCHLALRAQSALWPKDARSQIEVVRWFSWDLQHFTRPPGRCIWNTSSRRGLASVSRMRWR